MASQDLEMYDRLVVNNEREAHQTWHGGPQGHYNQAALGIHDARYTISAVVGPYLLYLQMRHSFELLCGTILLFLDFFYILPFFSKMHIK